MKTNFKKAIMPLAVVMLGAVAAFATNATKQSELNPLVKGYHYDSTKPPSEQCTLIGNFDCTPISGTPICEDLNNVQLWQLDENGLVCTTQLFKRM